MNADETSSPAVLSPSEVAVLAGVPERTVERAIKDHLLTPRAIRSETGRPRRMLPVQAVAYAAAIAKLDLRLTADQKKRLAHKLAEIDPESITKARIEIAPAVEIDIGRLVGDAVQHADHYRKMRNQYIVIDPEIQGGKPVIRGTRITVSSVLGQVDRGDTIDLIAEDNYDIPREAFEVAVIYGRSHPFVRRRAEGPG